MATLKVSFSKPKSFKIFAWVIMKVDSSTFSHVSVSWDSPKLERTVVYQASSVMVNFVEGKRFLEEHEVIADFDLEMDSETHKKVVQFAMDRAGIPYGIMQCVGIGWVKLMKLFGKKVKNPFPNGTKNYVCCELVADLLNQDFGFAFQDLDNLTPTDVFNILAKTKLSKNGILSEST